MNFAHKTTFGLMLFLSVQFFASNPKITLLSPIQPQAPSLTRKPRSPLAMTAPELAVLLPHQQVRAELDQKVDMFQQHYNAACHRFSVYQRPLVTELSHIFFHDLKTQPNIEKLHLTPWHKDHERHVKAFRALPKAQQWYVARALAEKFKKEQEEAFAVQQ